MARLSGSDLVEANGVTVLPLVDEGLGNSAYLVDLGDGRALAVDASRDLRDLHATAHKAGLAVAFAADTHLHADFVSGARQLAAGGEVTLLASAAGGRSFDHVGLRDGDEVDLGGLRLRALSTPGHTDEHLSYLLLDGDRPVGVFSGGSLIVGSAARTDLVDPARTDELARAQYASVRRLAELPDEVALWPTHGAGSFCSAPSGAQRTSTIGAERSTNSLLQARDEDDFVARLVGSLSGYPTYFDRLAEVNRRGPAVLADDPALRPVAAPEVAAMLRAGALLVDSRPVRDYAARHVTGSVSIALRPAFATWLGWLAPPDRPVLVLRGADQDPGEIAWQAAKIDIDLAGEVAGGIAAAEAAGLPVTVTPVAVAQDATSRPLVDVRPLDEYGAGHVPSALNVDVGGLARASASGSLTTSTADVPPEALLMCGHGDRAATAASLLERAGHGDLAVLSGTPEDFAAARGSALATGP